MLHKFGWALSGALALLAVLALARASIAGPLDPPGPVGSSMRTLDSLLPSWSQNLTSTGGCASQRFQCVMASNLAVLDRETGLVWQRTPDNNYKTYEGATGYCHFTPIGGRYGWRLPTLTELWSLADDSADDNLPDGSPFINAGGGVYWSSSLWDEDDRYLVTLAFFGGFLEELTKAREGIEFSNTWCVRGGQALDDDPQYAEQPSWSRQLSADGGCNSQRFECVLSDQAVLDRETGLVWQRAPSTIADSWSNALSRCDERAYAGRLGWRLPETFELASLVDPTVAGAVKLPTGHPFDFGAGGTVFWTTSRYGGGSLRESVYFQGTPGPGGLTVYTDGNSSELSRYWCVRGGAGGYPH